MLTRSTWRGTLTISLLVGVFAGCEGRCEQASKPQCTGSSVGEATCAAYEFYNCATKSPDKGECRRAAKAFCHDYVGADGMSHFGNMTACEARCESGCIMSHGC